MLVLIVWQVVALVRDGTVVIQYPTWAVAVVYLRSGLYALFLSIPFAALLLHEAPAASDRRIHIRAAAIVASFLLVLLGLFRHLGHSPPGSLGHRGACPRDDLDRCGYSLFGPWVRSA